MAMLMERRFTVVVGMLLGAGLVMSIAQMKRGMGVAADESERQQQNQAAQEQGSLHGTGT
jgi:MFS superfamily sulfate permease-like transporter